MKLYISYCEQTPQSANELRSILTSKVNVVSVTENTPNRAAILDELQQDTNSWLVLLLNENFLKSAPCMDAMLAFVQAVESNGRVIPVLVDGNSTNPYSDQIENTRIDLDRSSIVIQYQNYWTDTYLSLRKEKWNIPSEKLPAYEQEVTQARNISNEIAAFLRLVRNAGRISYEEFKADDYKVLFDKIALQYGKYTAEKIRNVITRRYSIGFALFRP